MQKEEPSSMRWLLPHAVGLLVLWPLVLFAVYFFNMGRWAYLFSVLDEIVQTRTYLRIGENFGSIMLRRVLDLGCMAILLASATLIGLALMRALKCLEGLTLLNVLTALAVGVLFLGNAVLLLGLAGMMSLWVFWALVIASAIAGAFCNHETFSRQMEKPQLGFVITKFDLFEKFLLSLAIIAVGFNLIAAFTPEFEYDALEYHLGAPKEYLLDGRITFLPHCFYAAMPSLTEMLYLWGMNVRGGEGVAKLLHWAFGVLAALGAFAIGDRLFGRRVGLWAAVIFYTVPLIADLSMTARIDLATTFFATVAAANAAIFFQDKKTSGLWLAAIAAGAAFSTKYTAGPMVVGALTVTVGVMIGRMEGWKVGVKNVVLVFVISAAVVSPWLIKNLVQTGNPVFPLLHSVFQSPQWDAARDTVFVGFHSPKFDAAGLERFVRECRGYFFSEPLATPLFAMFLPLAVFFRNWSKSSRTLVLWLGFGVLAWFLCSFRPWRFVFLIYPVAAVFTAAVIERFDAERVARVALRVIVTMVVLTQTCLIALILFLDFSGSKSQTPLVNGLTLLTGQTTREEFLFHTSQPIWWMNQNLPNEAVVLYVGEARAYHARHKVLWNTTYDKSVVGELVTSAKTSDELLAVMKQRGITHIYLNESETKRLRDHYGYLKEMDWELFRSFLASHTDEIAPRIYRLQ